MTKQEYKEKVANAKYYFIRYRDGYDKYEIFRRPVKPVKGIWYDFELPELLNAISADICRYGIKDEVKIIPLRNNSNVNDKFLAEKISCYFSVIGHMKELGYGTAC
jgi:hypothetical protein